MANLFNFGSGEDFTPDPDDEIIEDHRDTFVLSSTGADADDEAYLLKVIERASELTLTRSTKTQHVLPSYTFKLPLPAGPTLKAVSKRWDLPYTYVLRALVESAIMQLECPTEALRARLAKHAEEVQVRDARNKRRQREYMGANGMDSIAS
jgi:hypothetical protein